MQPDVSKVRVSELWRGIGITLTSQELTFDQQVETKANIEEKPDRSPPELNFSYLHQNNNKFFPSLD